MNNTESRILSQQKFRCFGRFNPLLSFIPFQQQIQLSAQSIVRLISSRTTAYSRIRSNLYLPQHFRRVPINTADIFDLPDDTELPRRPIRAVTVEQVFLRRTTPSGFCRRCVCVLVPRSRCKGEPNKTARPCSRETGGGVASPGPRPSNVYSSRRRRQAHGIISRYAVNTMAPSINDAQREKASRETLPGG